MNATARATLDTLPIPVENGSLVRAAVTTVGADWVLAWSMDGGRRLETFGEPYKRVRDACRAAAAINARAGA